MALAAPEMPKAINVTTSRLPTMERHPQTWLGAKNSGEGKGAAIVYIKQTTFHIYGR